MAKLSDKLRAKLAAQRRTLDQSGTIIQNKDLTRISLRVLPCNDEVPGVPYRSLYCGSLGGDVKRGTTSPSAFGVACPVGDALDRIYKTGTKEARDVASKLVRRQVEYWMPVIERGNEGTVESPNVRIFRAKKVVYQTIMGMMLDEVHGENITDPVEGRDLHVSKSGTGIDTEWTVLRDDMSPLSEDAAMAEAIMEVSNQFDVRSSFYGVDREVLEAMHQALTDKPVPDRYWDLLDAFEQGLREGGFDEPEEESEVGSDDAGSEGVEGDDAGAAMDPEPEGAEPEGEEPEGEESPDGVTFGTTKGTFEWEEAQVSGVILGYDASEGTGTDHFLLRDDDDLESPYCVPVSDVKVVKPKPKAAKKAPAKKAPAKKSPPRKPSAASKVARTKK